MLLDLNFCEDTVNTWKLIGTAMYVIKIVVPLLVIITGIIPVFGVITKGSADEIPIAVKSVLSKMLAAILVFLVPVIIPTVIDMLVDTETSAEIRVCEICFKDPFGGECNGAQDDYQNEREDKKKEVEEGTHLPGGNLDTGDLEDAETPETENTSNQSKDPDSGGSGSIASNNVANGSKNIIIGDSRTVGMCASITGDWNNCSFNNSGGKKNGEDIYISQGSMSYSWFNGTAVSATNNLLSQSQGTKYNIYSLMGVNILLGDIDNYVSRYKQLADNDWKNHKIILVSVTPVDEGKEASNGYSTKNSNIETFNSKLKTVTTSNIVYCDVYNSIKNNFSTTDGLHYTESTYKEIYNLMKRC